MKNRTRITDAVIIGIALTVSIMPVQAASVGIANTTGNTTGVTSMNTGSVSGANINGTSSGAMMNNVSTPIVTPNWNTENQYWQNQFSSRPYTKNSSYSDFAPAYQYGVDTYVQNAGKPYQQLDQAQLRNNWERNHVNSSITWNQAQPAVRDSYDRLYSTGMSNTTTNTTTPTATMTR